MSAGWRAQVALVRGIPSVQPVLAAWAMALVGVIGAGMGLALFGNGLLATAGAVVPMTALVLRVALRRVVSPLPHGRARSRLGDLPHPLLPITPAQRFWGELLGNLAATGVWVGLGVVPVMVIALGNRLALVDCVPITLGAWLMGSLPVSGPRGWVRIARGLGLLLALAPAGLAELEPGEIVPFGVLSVLNLALWLAPSAVLREPTSVAKARGLKGAARWLERAARLPVRPGETAEGRLGRLAQRTLGHQALVLLAWAIVYACVRRLVGDDGSWNWNLELAFITGFGLLGPAVARDLAHFALGAPPSQSRPGLGSGLLLPIGHGRRLRIAARFALSLGLVTSLIGFAALVLTNSSGTAYFFGAGVWVTQPFEAVDRLARGEHDAVFPGQIPGLLAMFGVLILGYGVLSDVWAATLVGAGLTLRLWLPMAVRAVRVALP